MKWKNDTFKNEYLRIEVLNNHIDCKGIWVMHVREFNWHRKRIDVPDSATREEAQNKAVAMVKFHLTKMVNSLK